jgi:cell division protein FtsW (lipid II flippase)
MSDSKEQKRRLRLRLKRIRGELLSFAIKACIACAVIVWFAKTGPANGAKEWMALVASVLVLITFLVVVARYVLQRKRAVRDIDEELRRSSIEPS